jgi:hypothetical protein
MVSGCHLRRTKKARPKVGYSFGWFDLHQGGIADWTIKIVSINAGVDL